MGIYTKTKKVKIGIQWEDLSPESQYGIANEFGMTPNEMIELYKLDDAGVFIGEIEGYKEEKVSLDEFIDMWFKEADVDGRGQLYDFSESDLKDFKKDLKTFLED